MVGLSIMYAEVLEELDLVSWDVDNVCLLLQSPSTWVEFSFVLSYSGLQVCVPNCASVGGMCAIHEYYYFDISNPIRVNPLS